MTLSDRNTSHLEQYTIAMCDPRSLSHQLASNVTFRSLDPRRKERRLLSLPFLVPLSSASLDSDTQPSCCIHSSHYSNRTLFRKPRVQNSRNPRVNTTKNSFATNCTQLASQSGQITQLTLACLVQPYNCVSVLPICREN